VPVIPIQSTPDHQSSLSPRLRQINLSKRYEKIHKPINASENSNLRISKEIMECTRKGGSQPNDKLLFRKALYKLR
jgi:hypothetical protein